MPRMVVTLAALTLFAAPAAPADEVQSDDQAISYIQTDAVAIPETGYLVEELGSDLFWVTNGFQQTFFLTTGEGVVAVDAYLAAIAETTDEPITHVIYSHAHTDHIGAADRMPADAVRIAHQLTHDALSRANDPHRPLPTQTFTDRMVVTVGSQVLELSYRGPNHLSGNIIMYAPRQKVLSLMDFLFTGSAPFPYLGHAEDIPGLMRHHDILLEFDFEVFISGHITRAATRSDIEMQLHYLNDLRDHTDAVLAQTTVMETFQRLGPDTAIMTAMSVWLDEVAQEISDRMLETWAGTWPGVEAVTRYNAVPMIQSRRVD